MAPTGAAGDRYHCAATDARQPSDPALRQAPVNQQLGHLFHPRLGKHGSRLLKAGQSSSSSLSNQKSPGSGSGSSVVFRSKFFGGQSLKLVFEITTSPNPGPAGFW